VPELERLPTVKTPSHRRQFNPLAAQITKQLELKKEIYSDPLMPISEVSAALGNPSYSALRGWIKSGALKTVRFSAHGHHRVRLSELRRFLTEGARSQEVKGASK